MDAVGRILIMAEMHGRDLIRRHIALGLLVALPLSFYLTSMGSGKSAVAAGGIGMAFAVAGATLFSALSSLEVDQRLVLAGYRPFELLLGRLLFLGLVGLVMAAAFTGLMASVSHPTNAWLLGLGVGMVALQSVPLGLAIGAIVPRELEGTLVLIGVVGTQLAVRSTGVVAKTLPFYGPRRLIQAGITGHGPVGGPLAQTALYGLGLLILARIFLGPRLSVTHHGNVDDALVGRESVNGD
jgi:hypothetical protein